MILRRILLSSLLLPLWRETHLNEEKHETVSTTQRAQPKCRAGKFIGRMLLLIYFTEKKVALSMRSLSQ